MHPGKTTKKQKQKKGGVFKSAYSERAANLMSPGWSMVSPTIASPCRKVLDVHIFSQKIGNGVS